MDDAAGRDQFVRRIALEIQLSRFHANCAIQGPDLDLSEQSAEGCRIQVNFDAPELAQFRDLPKNGDPSVQVRPPSIVLERFAPAESGMQRLLAGSGSMETVSS